jgi:hypothetical protein
MIPVKVYYRKGHVPWEASDVKFSPSLYEEVWNYQSLDPVTPNDVFEAFNIDSNPLIERQDIIVNKGLKHTSMSIGDVVQIGDTKYIALNEGWRAI